MDILRFMNNGNNCYLNSVIQSLFNTRAFSFLFARDKEILSTYEIINHLKRVYNSNYTVNLVCIKKLFANFDAQANTLFGNNGQQDAHEAIIKILDIIQLVSKQFFTGQFKTTVECTECEYTSVTYNNFTTLNIDVYGKNIIDCIVNFIKKEPVDGRCACGNTKLLKTMTIHKLPRTLIVCINRFEYINGRVCKIKIPLSINNKLRIQNNNIMHVYALSSVVYHIGSTANSGHYNVDIHKNNTWYAIDDDHVYVKDAPSLSDDCYILIYDAYNY